MYEAYCTYVDDKYFDNHDYDDDTDADTDNDTGDDTDDDIDTHIKYEQYRIPKASFKWVPNLDTSSGHEPIIDRSYGAPIFLGVRSSSRSIRQWPSWVYGMDLRGS